MPAHLEAVVGDFGGLLPGVQIASESEVSTDDLLWLASAGFELHVQADGPLPFDLGRIASPLHEFTRVFLAGLSRPQYTGWHVLESCTQLEQLELTSDPDVSIDFSRLRALTAAVVRGPNSVSMLQAPKLESLKITTRIPSGVSVVGPVRSLAVIEPSVSDIGFVSDASSLENLLLNGCRTFDAMSLVPAKGLGLVRFYRCREITGVEALLRLPKLRVLDITGARTVPGFESLLELGDIEVEIDENYVFSDEFRVRVGHRPSWTVEPLRSPPTSRVAGSKVTAMGHNDAARAKFYRLIDQVRDAESGASADPVALGAALAQLGSTEVRAFARQLDRELQLLDTGEISDVGSSLVDGWSDDAFLDFRLYLIGRGRDLVDVAASKPNELPSLIHTVEPFNEALGYVASEVLDLRR